MFCVRFALTCCLLTAALHGAPAAAFTQGKAAEIGSAAAAEEGGDEAAPGGQPSEERSAQDSLPQSKDPMWDILAKCKVTLNQTDYTYSIALTPEVKALEGQKITVSGFMLPLDADEEFTHYLLSKRTPTCPFCPPGEPNEIAEVFAATKIKWDENLMTVTGTLKLTNDPEKGLFFQITDAESTASQPVPGAKNLAKPPL